MLVDEFIDKQEVEIDGKKFLISHIPAVQAQEIYGKIIRCTQDVGDIGMTFLPSDLTNEILGYAAARKDDCWINLSDEDLRNDLSIFPTLESVLKLEAAMIRKNFGFLFNGHLQKLLEVLRKGKADTSKQQ